MLSRSESVEDEGEVLMGGLESEFPWLREELLIFQPLKQKTLEQVLKHQLLMFLEPSSGSPKLPSQPLAQLQQQLP